MPDRSEIGVRIAGAAGQGMQTSADLLGRAATRAGLHALLHVEAQSRIRGGLNYSQLRIATSPTPAINERVDILIAQSPPALSTYGKNLPGGSLVIVQEEDWSHALRAPFALAPIAEEAGAAQAAGAVGVAVVAALAGIDEAILADLVREQFAGKERLVEVNLGAVRRGYEAAERVEGGARFALAGAEPNDGRLWIMGAEAVALGAVAGGVALVAAYPMSPATGVMTHLARWSAETGVVVEQAEDEIAAINMVAGASYAGARAMTATSGGGFALMTEGVSLLGMIETPAVIVIAQRPGPATGLPTRTAQGDLFLALHAGHGFFPRVILAPKDVADGFELTARAFDIAERFQVPVFVLTDQQLMDGQQTVESFDVGKLPVRRYLLTSGELGAMDEYERFALTEDGISPQAAPGVSRHTVVVTSDEHTEGGAITDTVAGAQAMAEKRLRRAATVARETLLPPAVADGPAGAPLVISWGSSHAVVDEVLREPAVRGEGVSHLHLRRLWPLDEADLTARIDRAARVVVVENNVGGDLAELIQRVTGRRIDHRVNRIDGRPFTVGWLAGRLASALSEGNGP